MSETLKDYFDALNRLKNGKPVLVPKGTRITHDSVSLEAGRKKGSIKKSRPIFIDLINAIASAQLESEIPNDLHQRLKEAKAEAARYRVLWEEALAREVSLVKQLWDEREAWGKERAAFGRGKITSINRSKFI